MILLENDISQRVMLVRGWYLLRGWC